MKYIFYILCVLVFEISCNSDNSNVKKEISENRIIDANENESIIKARDIIEDISDSTIINKFIAHEEFYCPDHKYKDLKVIKISSKTYDISYQCMDVSGKYFREWSHGISRIVLLPDGKCNVELKKGPICI